jgi:hypothetical protein
LAEEAFLDTTAGAPAFSNQGPLIGPDLLTELNTQQAQLQLQTGYQLRSRWRLMAGAELAFVTVARGSAVFPVDQATAEPVYFNSNFDLYQQEFSYVSSRTSSSSSALTARRWRLGATAGLAYRLSRHWSGLLEFR